MSDNRLPAKSTLCSGSLHLSIEIGSMWHACRLHLASETLMWASMAFWRGEQAYCPCLEPCFKHLWSWQYMTVSNKDVLLAVSSCFLCSLCCRELYVVTLFQYSQWTIRLCVQELPLVSANSLDLSLCMLLTNLSSDLLFVKSEQQGVVSAVSSRYWEVICSVEMNWKKNISNPNWKKSFKSQRVSPNQGAS